jgi:serine/threonine protein kinase
MRSGRSSPCSPTTADALLDALRTSRLLSTQQLDDLALEAQEKTLEAAALASMLVERGALTAYQAEQLLSGGESLRLGHYRILDRLGVGGMSRVYKAEHLLMKRVVALKLLSAPWSPDPSALSRFYQEVQAIAQLCHPNIVAAHDAAEEEGVPFLVMEYVEGVDLERLVREEGPLPLALACECIRQVALGLQHAYERGFVHGDIKPSNLLLQRRAECGSSSLSAVPAAAEDCPLVKILDLGLARLIGAPLRETYPTQDEHGEGSFAGTPDYLAPEQARCGQAADIRSDLYSLGCTFYYLLTGRVPYPGGSIAEKLLRHQLDLPTPVTQLRPDTPAEIAVIVHRLLAKEPAERFALPADLALLLQEWLCLHQEPLDLSPQAALSWKADTHPAVESPTMLSQSREVMPVLLPFPRTPGEDTSNSPEEAPLSQTVSPAQPWRRHRLSWPVMVAVAVAVGIGTASLARLAPAPEAVRLTTSAPLSKKPAFVTVARMPGSTFAGLEAALEVAQDGDTLVLHGDGPFRTRPLAIQGKALALQAEPGCHPRVELVTTQTERPWQALLATDRPLILEGLELARGAQDDISTQAGAAHLVYADPARLRLARCRLLAPRGAALLVCRNTQHVELAECLLVAHASACCIEVGNESRPVVEVRGTTIQVSDRRAAALSVWAAEEPGRGCVELHLERNTVEAGRIAAFAGLGNGVAVRARENSFVFHEALLSFVGFTDAADCRRATRWYGECNRYEASTHWLSLDGRPAEMRSLEEWQRAWQIQESGSSERAPRQSLRTSMATTPQQPSLP